MWSHICTVALFCILSAYGETDVNSAVLPGLCAAVNLGTGRWQTKCPTATAQTSCESMAPKCQWMLSTDLTSDAKMPNVEGSMRAPFSSGTQTCELLISRTEVTITMVGWSTGGWFAFGFGADTMEGTYAIVAEGSMFDPSVSEYQLSKFSEDQQDNRVDSGLTIVSDTTEGLYRTVVMKRPREADCYTFPQETGKIEMIAAKANYYEPYIVYHGSTRDQTEIRMDLVDDVGESCRTECCSDDDCSGLGPFKLCLSDGSCGKEGSECTFDCCSDDDCRGSQLCLSDNVCGKAEAECAFECCADDECRGSKVCNDGVCGKAEAECADECCSDDECRGAKVCNDGVCGKYKASESESAESECYTDDDCVGRKTCKGGSCTNARRAREREMFVEAEDGSGSGAETTEITATTSNVLLSIALLVTAAFAMQQLWRWWRVTDEKLEVKGVHEISPLLSV